MAAVVMVLEVAVMEAAMVAVEEQAEAMAAVVEGMGEVDLATAVIAAALQAVVARSAALAEVVRTAPSRPQTARCSLCTAQTPLLLSPRSSPPRSHRLL